MGPGTAVSPRDHPMDSSSRLSGGQKESIDKIETLLVHELFHFQQLVATGPDEFYALFGEKKTLLGLTIREGAAEFVANRNLDIVDLV